MQNIFYKIQIVLAVIVLIAAESCIVPTAQKAVLISYDSVRNITLLHSARETVEIQQHSPGREPAELRAEVFYECPGHDTNCLPIGLQIRWTLIVYRTNRQLGGDFAKMNVQRFRAGDNITIVGKQWNTTFLVDSVASNEKRSMFFQGNNAYENVELITYLYCSTSIERLLTIVEASSFSVTLAGRQMFYKSGGAWKNIAEFCLRAQSKTHR